MSTRTYTLTYDRATPESAEDGDTSDHGFGDGSSLNTTSLLSIEANYPHGSDEWREQYDAARAAATDTITPDEYDRKEAAELLDFPADGPEAESAAAVVLMADLIRRHYGCNEPSSYPDWTPGAWYTATDGSTDYATGEVTRVSVHLDGWTDDEQRAIYRAVTGRVG